jgi:DNA-binding MarR family transcriptional regulator
MQRVLRLVSMPAPPSTVAGGSLDLGRFLPFRLSVLGSRVTRAVARVYTVRFQLSAPEWRTLAVLGRYGAMSAQEVAEHTAMDKVRVSRSVRRLVARRRITRRADPLDRRRAILDLTAEGRTVYSEIVPLVLAVEADLMADLSEPERAAFETAIAKIENRTADHVTDEDSDL